MRRAALLLAALSLLVGCQTPGPVRTLSPDDPRVTGVLARLRERAEARQSLRALAHFVVNAEDRKFRGSQRLALRRPRSLRVELLGLFSQTAGLLATDGITYDYFDPRVGEVEHGRVWRRLLWQVARVDLTPAEAVSVLLGAPPPGLRLIPSEAQLLADGGLRVRLDNRQGEPRERIEVDSLGRLRRFEKFGRRGFSSWDVSYADYREIGDVSFAYDVDIRFPDLGASAVFRFREVELDLPLPDELFRLDLPNRVSSARGEGDR
ncbi:MAG: hypothetical protein O7A09_10290 [Proteobacteria bacterium]|nr:hypothetical protein [Pseudomonadota bacterium]